MNKKLEEIVVAKLDLKKLDTNYLIELAIRKTKLLNELKEEIDKLTTQIQVRAIDYSEQRHIKFTELKGQGSGLASVTVANGLEVLNYAMLEAYFGKELLKDKIKIKPQNTKYEFDSGFKKAIMALLYDDYESKISLNELIDSFSFVKGDVAKKATLLKKLKGDYKKDKKLIFDMLNKQASDDFDIDIELYLIYQIKNYEYIKAYFDTDKLEETKDILNCYLSATQTPKISLKEF